MSSKSPTQVRLEVHLYAKQGARIDATLEAAIRHELHSLYPSTLTQGEPLEQFVKIQYIPPGLKEQLTTFVHAILRSPYAYIFIGHGVRVPWQITRLARVYRFRRSKGTLQLTREERGKSLVVWSEGTIQ